MFTWRFENSEVGVPPGSSTVEVTLEPDGEGTLLRLVHRGLPEAERGAHAKGWEKLLSGAAGPEPFAGAPYEGSGREPAFRTVRDGPRHRTMRSRGQDRTDRPGVRYNASHIVPHGTARLSLGGHRQALPRATGNGPKEGTRIERYVERFGVDPTPGRSFIAAPRTSQ